MKGENWCVKPKCKNCNSEKMVLAQLQLSKEGEIVWSWFCPDCKENVIYTKDDYDKIYETIKKEATNVNDLTKIFRFYEKNDDRYQIGRTAIPLDLSFEDFPSNIVMSKGIILKSKNNLAYEITDVNIFWEEPEVLVDIFLRKLFQEEGEKRQEVMRTNVDELRAQDSRILT